MKVRNQDNGKGDMTKVLTNVCTPVVIQPGLILNL